MKNIILISLFVLFGCGLNGEKSNLKFEELSIKKNNEISVTNPNEDLEFLKLKNNILNNNCIECHNQATQLSKGRVDLTLKDNVYQNSDLIIYLMENAYISNATKIRPMPLVNGKSVKLDQKIIDEFKAWKEKEDTNWEILLSKKYREQKNFDFLKKNLFEASCTRCHNSSNTKRVDLTKKENIVDSEIYKNILCSIARPYNEECEISKMPPKLGNDLSVKQELVNLLETWKQEYDSIKQ